MARALLASVRSVPKGDAPGQSASGISAGPLAPRCFRALAPRPTDGAGRHLLGERKESLPSACCASCLPSSPTPKTRRIPHKADRLGRPEAHNPFLSAFGSEALSLRNFCALLRDGAHPFVTDAPAEMPEAEDPDPTSCACPTARVETHALPTHARTNPRR